MTRLVPLIERAVPYVSQLLDGVVRIAEWASRNPFESFAGLVTGFFITELGKAQIADLIKNAISGGGGGGVGGAAGAGAAGLIAVGAAAQIGSITNLADERYGAVTAGRARGAQLAQDLQSGDESKRSAAMAAYRDAQDKGGSGATASAWLDTAVRGVMGVANPLAYGAAKLGDAAVEKAGVQSNAQRSVEAIKAHEIINVPDLRASVALAIEEGARDAMRSDKTAVGNPERSQPLVGRAGN
jgi:hypothetical protein